MTPPRREQKAVAGVFGVLGVVFRGLASLRLAVILLVLLGVILATTTIVEAHKGAEFAHWYVYKSWWFIALLALLGANVQAAVLVRFPYAKYFTSLVKYFPVWLVVGALLAMLLLVAAYGVAVNFIGPATFNAIVILLGMVYAAAVHGWHRRHQAGFVVTHLGVVVLLIGSLQTFLGGIEGQLPFGEGDTVDSIFIPDRGLLKADLHGEDDTSSTEFAFSPGPFDWPEGKTLDFGQAEGIGLKVLRYYRHAREEASWVADESGLGRPALEFALNGPRGKSIAEHWLVADVLGGQTTLGPAKFALFATSLQSMVRGFLDPPLPEAGENGVLSMCYQDQVLHVDVKDNVGKKVPLSHSGISVQIIEYLPDAAPGTGGRLISRGKEPRNPTLDLLVYLPGLDEPIREIASARFPALNLEAAHGGRCPVKFWYYHPAAIAQPGVEFLQGPDGRLYCRVASGGKYVWQGEASEGDEIETWAGLSVSILEYIPHARREVSFRSVPRTDEEALNFEAAALVELSLDDETEQVWIQRNGQKRTIQTPKGLLELTFGYDKLPLGFSLKLLDFEHGLNPGRVGDASFASSVQLVDRARGLHEKREISMNKPLVHGKFTFYQSSFRELPDGAEVSILSVSHDPGRLLKYFGSLMICVGTLAVFYLKGRWFREGFTLSRTSAGRG